MGTGPENVRVSIITIALNAGDTIAQTFEAMLAQTYRGPIEYILKDGGSTDATLKVAEEYRERFEARNIEFRVFSEPDKGIYDAMNRGIDLTTGEIVGMINADDRYEPGCIEAVVKKYNETGFDLCFGNLRIVMPSGKSFVKKARYRRYTTSRDWNHPTQFVKRSVYDRFRFRCLNISDDMDLYFAVKKTDAKIVVIDEVLADFTIGGVSTKIPARQIPERIHRRYMVYRINGYSRAYIIECVAFELVKYLGARFG
ncbi:MAG TPA: glycosyltransferase [Lachnospiraceae bacterium]|nr:glycosyltransferase [Lachnospiraceae bacterium]HCS00442.1 glycosyltransferase [Lachnospiraceae bacterium]